MPFERFVAKNDRIMSIKSQGNNQIVKVRLL